MTSKLFLKDFDQKNPNWLDIWLTYIRVNTTELQAARISLANDGNDYIEICEQLAAEKIVYG